MWFGLVGEACCTGGVKIPLRRLAGRLPVFVALTVFAVSIPTSVTTVAYAKSVAVVEVVAVQVKAPEPKAVKKVVLKSAKSSRTSKTPKSVAKKKKVIVRVVRVVSTTTTSAAPATSGLPQVPPDTTVTVSTTTTVPTSLVSAPPVSQAATTTSSTSTTVAVTRPTLPALVPGAAPAILPNIRKFDPGSELPADLTPAEYVYVVVGWTEQYSVRRRQVDMANLRARVELATANAATIADTYPSLQLYLEALGDNHSFLYTPALAKVLLSGTGKSFGFQVIDQVMFPLPGSPALNAGIRDRDRLIAVNGEPYSRTMRLTTIGDTATFTVQHAGEATPVTITVTRGEVKTSQLPTVKALDDRLGYIDLPGSTGSKADEVLFTQTGQRGIRDVDTAGARCGWVLDLRRNTGGYPYSMLAAISALYGNAELGGTVDIDGNINRFSTFNGALRVNGLFAVPASGGIPPLSQPNGPIAILTSSATASAGELAMVGFAGRPGVRTFGDPTFGVPSGNVGRSFPDGSFLAVTNTLDIDRTGRTYIGPLLPDEPVAMDWSFFGTPEDPVLAAATRWAKAQPACSLAKP